MNPGSSKDLPEPTRTAQLPQGVAYVHAKMGVLTPSLVAVAVCFTFDEERSAIFEDALRTDCSPISKKTPRGWEHYQPGSQKGNEIRRIREDLVKLAAGWVSENFPGVFSSGLLGDSIPTCELLTFRKAVPLPAIHERDPVAHHYLQLLGVYWGNSAWVVSSRPGLKFNLSHHVFFGPTNHCVLTSIESEVGNPPHHVDSQLMPGILCASKLKPR